MSVLVIGDLHCRLQYLNDFNEMASKLVVVAQEKKPDTIILLGDTLHDHAKIHTSQYNAAITLIANLKNIAPVVLLIGNHDYVNASQYLSEEHPFNALKWWSNVTVVDKPMLINDMVFCPYVPPGRFKEALDTCIPEWQDAAVIFAHQEFKGANEGTYVSDVGDVWDDSYPFVITGHIHTRQTIGSNILYPGTPAQYTFGDDNNKSVSFFDDSWSEKRISLDVKKKISIEVPSGDFADLEIPPDSHVRIEVVCTVSEYASIRKSAKYKKLVSEGVKIIPRVADKEIEREVRHVTYYQALREKVATESMGVQTTFNELFGDRE